MRYGWLPMPKAMTLWESSSSGRVRRWERAIIRTVPDRSARKPALRTIRLIRLIDCSAGSKDLRTTNLSGDVAAEDRSSVAARNRVRPKFTVEGVWGVPENNRGCVIRPACPDEL